jgi:CheY-like chemotaxis protein
MAQPTETERTGRFARDPAPDQRSSGAGLVHQVVEAARDARVTVDARGAVTGWNRAAEHLFGTPLPRTAVGVQALLEALAGLPRKDGELIAREPAEPPGGPLSVLVVDDDAAFRLAVGHGLAAEGFEVQTVCSATDAYRAVEQERFDLIVLDWVMPGGDGGAVACRRLCEMHPSGDVVILTGLTDLRDQRAARDAGASAFLQKGTPIDILGDRLRAVAGAQGL